MRLSVISLAVTLGLASGQYDDGYEVVDSPVQPVQVRLAYNGPNGMTVSWNTFQQLQMPTVRYGLTPFTLFQTASSDISVTYPTSLTYNNHVQINNLLPGTTYFYLPDHSNTTTPYNFTTQRPTSDKRPFSVAIVVDMGTFGALGLSDHVGKGAANPLQPGEQTTIQSLIKQLDSFDFLIHPGDIAYADYWLKEEIGGYLPNTTIANGSKIYEHILNAFYDEMVPITSVKPYMVSPGNHEANCDNGGTTDKTHNITYTEKICMVGQTNFTGFRNHFRMPSGPSGGLENFWYSYDAGMVHFVSIDTETDLGHNLTGPDEGSPEFTGPFGLHDAQINWLKNDLASVDRSKTPWVVALGHRPFYSSTTGNCANCTAAFEDLFYQYGVDMYHCGHSHVYERMAPIYRNVTDPNELNNPKATWYILNGAAGHYDGLDTFNSVMMPYSRYSEDTFYTWDKLTFHNCTHMTLDAIQSSTGQVFDSATLFKNRTCSGSSFPSFPTSFTVPTSIPKPTWLKSVL